MLGPQFEPLRLFDPEPFDTPVEQRKAPEPPRKKRPPVDNIDLPMFVTGRELAEDFTHNDTPDVRNAEAMYRTDNGGRSPEYDRANPGEFLRSTLKNWKLTEAKYSYRGAPSLYDRVASEGVKDPVSAIVKFGYPERRLVDGHHRAFASADIDPDRLVPVHYYLWDLAHADEDIVRPTRPRKEWPVID